jgi:hypothetical protein
MISNSKASAELAKVASYFEADLLQAQTSLAATTDAHEESVREKSGNTRKTNCVLSATSTSKRQRWSRTLSGRGIGAKLSGGSFATGQRRPRYAVGVFNWGPRLGERKNS